jgi:hypothetical protein
MRHHRDTHGHNEIDNIAHFAAALHSGLVLPGRQDRLYTRVSTVLKRRCRTQRTEVSRGASSAIADGVSGNHQSATAEGHDNAEDPGNKH